MYNIIVIVMRNDLHHFTLMVNLKKLEKYPEIYLRY